jgi:hypothetical protein
MSLASKVQQYDVLVGALFELLDVVEVTDEGREFRPTVIRSCRAMTGVKLDKILVQLKSTLQDKG